jgi:hypothetical protein
VTAASTAAEAASRCVWPSDDGPGESETRRGSETADARKEKSEARFEAVTRQWAMRERK